ncbi:MAG TPA: hypothetical protein PK587_09850 [Syntrophales bacterium]|nr:hypothetical protein [Syntrophales bacterium]
MIFRLDVKLADKIKAAPLNSLSADPNPYADWTARLFTASRIRYILISNTRSLYSVVMPGKGASSDSAFLHAAANAIEEFLRADVNEFIFRRFVAPEMEKALFAKALNRSVTGSMNDLVYQAKIDLIHFSHSLHEISSRLNEVPMSCLKYKHPREVFMTMMLKESD